eukprot:Skav225744  [mRNA]  locus=scaffold28:68471:75385:- [translate_table: standard]
MTCSWGEPGRAVYLHRSVEVIDQLQESDKEQIAWGDWSEWSGCSVSCGGGVTFRRRRVDVMANHCGSEPTGKNSEIRYCHVGVPCSRPIDCELSEWETWSACSGTCDGLRHRARVVKVYGRGTGAWCKGVRTLARSRSITQYAENGGLPCGIPRARQSCGGPEPKDCIFAEWEERSSKSPAVRSECLLYAGVGSMWQVQRTKKKA